MLSRAIPLALLCVSFALPALAQDKDPKAVALATQVMDAMGGLDTFNAQAVIGFSFAGDRGGSLFFSWSHLWDRASGMYRVEGTTGEGDFMSILLNIQSKGGQAWKNGTLLEGDDAVEWVERGYLRFINDSYWLLFPWKWLDDGVHLAYQGTQERDGKTYEVVHLSFDDGTGVTSGDRYWGFVDPETHLLARWEFVLQNEDGTPGEGEPTAWLWEDWTDVGGGVKMALRKSKLGAEDGLALVHPLAMVSTVSDPAWFTPDAKRVDEILPAAKN